ncbi:MAG: glycoside hydrolase family 6 protein [Microbacterium sp.]|uniref:glycoside hydrolase family 6 protein n=1 Tax=Microbacterium sp. TaxID=51671 RepID=UPI001D45AC54|nr:glycoside hydrolase family 6 protein [Microbacterium sp.]MBW8764368.1 glycoside hydrolase family 6 protein [Microbacterium sp.]
MIHRRPRAGLMAAVALIGSAVVLVPSAVHASAAPVPAAEPDAIEGLELYVDPLSTTLESAQALTGQARADAQLLASIPSATWFTGGTPEEVHDAVDRVVSDASAEGTLPVLVAYNVPYRDCSLYSAGGAADTEAYNAWIDAFADAIGDRKAVVMIEPDGLGVIPHYTTLDGSLDSCRPAEADPATAAPARFAQLNHAVDAFAAHPGVRSYLDGTNAAWLNVGEVSSRLVSAGVERATGFFLNVSNYLYTANNTAYGTWISSCIAYATQVAEGAFGDCGNQYWNGGPANDWQGVTMSQYGEWASDASDPALSTAGLDSRYAEQLGSIEPSARFIVDTSRNGIGPWEYPANTYPQHEDWCNPPGRGAGARPTTTTGVPLADAFLWVKVPGESDGKCYRGTGGPLDPARGIEDPAAGQWFPEQARELVSFASPLIEPLSCDVTISTIQLGRVFMSTVSVTNATAQKIEPWSLTWRYDQGQKVVTALGGRFTQQGTEIAVSGTKRSPGLDTGETAGVVVVGKGDATVPWQLRLNGRVCTSR